MTEFQKCYYCGKPFQYGSLLPCPSCYMCRPLQKKEEYLENKPTLPPSIFPSPLFPQWAKIDLDIPFDCVRSWSCQPDRNIILTGINWGISHNIEGIYIDSFRTQNMELLGILPSPAKLRKLIQPCHRIELVVAHYVGGNSALPAKLRGYLAFEYVP